MLDVKYKKNVKSSKALLLVAGSKNDLIKNMGNRPAIAANNLAINYSEKHLLLGVWVDNKTQNHQDLEKLRVNISTAIDVLNAEKQVELAISFDKDLSIEVKIAVLESIILSNYQFLKLKSKPKELENSLNLISLEEGAFPKKSLAEILNVCQAVYKTRDLVNWPQKNQTAEDLSNSFTDFSKEAGFSINVLNETQIESMKMGGLLAVNQGSSFPPTFSVMEWKPKSPVNKKPIVLIGKGIVYDTGGLSLKAMPGMASMKCDMHGAATVGGLMYAIAKNKLNLHVIGLVPATDNWIGQEAYAPGDVITMFDGSTVEILNTDAEGRLVLADALHYAKKYKPEIVFDFATLTGAAVRAIGPYGTVIMGTAAEKVFNQIQQSGNNTYERTVHFPLWPEYKEELKSSIADLTNLGKGEGGAQSAGMFLKHFTDYPWVHFDIAGPSFNDKNDGYRKVGGTGVGVRLLYHYLKTFYKL